MSSHSPVPAGDIMGSQSPVPARHDVGSQSPAPARHDVGSQSAAPARDTPQPSSRHEDMAVSPHGPLAEGTTAQLTSPAEPADARDSEQTFAKQLIDPWKAADHIESQSPGHPPRKPYDDPHELQSMYFEEETVVQIDR